VDLLEQQLTLRTREEFAAFVDRLREDLLNRPGDWENPTLDRFLDAMASWVAASHGYFRNIGEPYPEGINWSFFAGVLLAARIYE
jgi:hypothetical protein